MTTDVANATTGTSAATTAAPPSRAVQSQEGFDDQYTTFLTLLTTQLQNQNPLEPLDTNQFTQQIVEYSSLEQQINQNSNLERLIAAFEGFSANAALNYVGDRVSYGGTTTTLENGAAEWGYTLAGTAEETTITIRDASGAIVRTLDGETTNGRHSFVWNGRDDDGAQLEDGVYQITVEARDADDNLLPVSTEVSGIVTGADLTAAEPTLLVNGNPVPVSAVRTVSVAS